MGDVVAPTEECLRWVTACVLPGLALAMNTALISHSPVASFFDDFCMSPDVFTAGDLGLTVDVFSNVPSDDEPESVSVAKDATYTAAVH